MSWGKRDKSCENHNKDADEFMKTYKSTAMRGNTLKALHMKNMEEKSQIYNACVLKLQAAVANSSGWLVVACTAGTRCVLGSHTL